MAEFILILSFKGIHFTLIFHYSGTVSHESPDKTVVLILGLIIQAVVSTIENPAFLSRERRKT